MFVYSDASKAQDKYSMPNVEVFYCEADSDTTDEEGNPVAAGWYYWYCQIGCLPDSSPYGPFDTEELAIKDVQDQEQG